MQAIVTMQVVFFAGIAAMVLFGLADPNDRDITNWLLLPVLLMCLVTATFL